MPDAGGANARARYSGRLPERGRTGLKARLRQQVFRWLERGRDPRGGGDRARGPGQPGPGGARRVIRRHTLNPRKIAPQVNHSLADLFPSPVPSGESCTAGMKTAVSIPNDIFARAERLASQAHRSSSDVYASALDEYLARRLHDEVTDATNRACGEIGGSDETFLATAGRRRSGRRAEPQPGGFAGSDERFDGIGIPLGHRTRESNSSRANRTGRLPDLNPISAS